MNDEIEALEFLCLNLQKKVKDLESENLNLINEITDLKHRILLKNATIYNLRIHHQILKSSLCSIRKKLQKID